MNKGKLQRELLKAKFNLLKDIETDQKQKLPQPLLQKSVKEDEEIIILPKVDRNVIVKRDIFDCIMDRSSNRVYTEESLSLEELSFLLWSTQGVKKLSEK
ncbi:hypothetical protein [Clostridium carboxidivorans]|uniref:hypothetical protein n=1 Tax=Clostridium carboxidivorans TaxID=217159 RepID=UPI0002E64E10|nr:hypothetical protein [Clostridium carboxidivorans]